MARVKLKNTIIKLEFEGKEKTFSLWHNMTVNGNINTLHAAIDNWLARTSVFSEKALCKYIMGKGTDMVCYTNYQYHRITLPIKNVL